MSFSSVKEISRLINKGMSNIYYWEKLTFSETSIFPEKKFEEQKVITYVWEEVYFGIIVFSCLSSTKPCIRFLLICFTREIIRILSEFLEEWGWFQRHNECFSTTLISSCHWKTLEPFCLQKEKYENAFLTLMVNDRKIVQKTNYAIQNNRNLTILT